MNNENIEKKSIWQKELNLKEASLYIGVFALFMIYIFVFIYPKYTEYKSSVTNLQQIESEISNYQGKIDTLPQLQQQLASLNEELNSKGEMLSNNMEDGMFLVGLSNLMKSLNVDLVSYSVDETIPYNSFYAIPTTIEVRGNYNYIRKIMNYMEEQKNMTQILDYNMETYIEEPKETETKTEATTNAVSDSVVYWTEQGTVYHKKECSTLAEHGENITVLSGSAADSKKSNPCEVCKPYTTTSGESQTVETSEPKAKGDIVARFKFVMYSSNNPANKLDNDDDSTWKPGKYNPFTSTTK